MRPPQKANSYQFTIAAPVAIEWSRKLASFAAAMQVAEKAAPGSVTLCMLPDTAERYLSSPLFEGIPEGMTDQELALMRSTPGYHMPSA